MFKFETRTEQAREVRTFIRELRDIVPVAVCSGNHDNTEEKNKRGFKATVHTLLDEMVQPARQIGHEHARAQWIAVNLLCFFTRNGKYSVSEYIPLRARTPLTVIPTRVKA
jgi:metallophosphoesterase superfamily enzyme